MGPFRSVARVLMAGIYVDGGLGAWRDPEPKAALARPVIERLAEVVPGLPPEPVTLVRANAAVQVAAGAALAIGVVPRLAALALAGSLVPTTLGGHRFWEVEGDPARRNQQRIQFLKNSAMLGGLVLVAFD